MLSPVSQDAAADAINEQISYIDMDMIVSNKLNDFSNGSNKSVSRINCNVRRYFAANNFKVGKNKEGKYVLTTGERRWRAGKLLHEEGRFPEKYKNKVPCIFRSPESLEMNLSQENKEKFSILVTNQTREKTDGDKMRKTSFGITSSDLELKNLILSNTDIPRTVFHRRMIDYFCLNMMEQYIRIY